MKKILVANRGEIAIRVMKTAQKMGIKTVAVYSTIDRNAPHVKFADEAVWIGEAPSNQSYLLGDKIIEVAKSLNVDAIHPGYGFLSENADFAEEVEKNNLIFIGPKSKAIRVMGSKLAAKEAVMGYNIPMVPGVDHAIIDIDEAKALAESFNAHFSLDAVRLHVLSPTCWVVGTNDAWQLSLPTLEDAIAMNLKDAFQSGKDAQRWRKLLNETQMLWFTHEVNIQREVKGLLPINGLWVLKQRAWWLFW
jgi:hypothetical protein